MNWEHPQLLWTLVLVPILAFCSWKFKASTALFFPHGDVLPSRSSGKAWWRRVVQTLELFVLAVILLGLAGPRQRYVTEKESHEGMAIQLVVDVSSSMDINFKTDDRSLTRMEAAKKVLQKFIAGGGDQLQGRSEDLIGLITFARYSDVVCPLTLSHSALIEMTKDLHVNETPNEDGTAYGDALALASAQLKSFEERLKSDQSDSSQATSKIVVLLTDGENNCGLHMPEQAAAMAAEWEIKVYVISMGDMGDRQRMIVNGEAFQTKGLMNDNAWLLKKMAESTGGLYKHAEDYDSLLSVYEKIDALEKGQLQTQSLERYTPALGPFALAALLGLLFSVALRFWGLKGQ